MSTIDARNGNVLFGVIKEKPICIMTGCGQPAEHIVKLLVPTRPVLSPTSAESITEVELGHGNGLCRWCSTQMGEQLTFIIMGRQNSFDVYDYLVKYLAAKNLAATEDASRVKVKLVPIELEQEIIRRFSLAKQ